MSVKAPRSESETTQRGQWLAPFVFASAPTLMLILTWSDSASASVRVAKAHGFPILAIELATICVALLGGRLPRVAFRNLMILAALLFVMWTSAFFAPAQGRSVLWTAIWLVHFGFGYSVAASFDDRVAVRAMLVAFGLFVVILTLRGMFWPVADWENNPPAFDQIRRFGYYAAAIAGLSIGLFALKRSMQLAFVCATLAFGMMFWSGARGAIAAIAIGAVVSIAIFPSARKRSVVMLAPAAALVGLAVASLLPVPVSSMGIGRMAAIDATMGATSGRTGMWRDVLQAIVEKPIFGWGEAQTHIVSLPLAQPHNVVLQLLLAWGILGTIAVGFLACAASVHAYRNVKAQPNLLPLAVAAMVILTYAMVDGALFHVHSVSIFAMSVGLLLRDPEEGSREK